MIHLGCVYSTRHQTKVLDGTYTLSAFCACILISLAYISVPLHWQLIVSCIPLLLQAVNDSLSTVCKCHGLCGACTVRICWKEVPSVSGTANYPQMFLF